MFNFFGKTLNKAGNNHSNEVTKYMVEYEIRQPEKLKGIYKLTFETTKSRYDAEREARNLIEQKHSLWNHISDYTIRKFESYL